MTRRYALTDAQWKRIEHLLPGRAGHVGRPAANNHLFVDAVLYRYRAGIPWRDLPERFGDFRVIHLRHSRWSRRGVWQRVFEALSQDADNEWAMIDSTILRAHQHSAGAKKQGCQAIPHGLLPLARTGARVLKERMHCYRATRAKRSSQAKPTTRTVGR